MVTFHWKNIGSEQEYKTRGEETGVLVEFCLLPADRPQLWQIIWNKEVISAFIPTKLLLIVKNHHE